MADYHRAEGGFSLSTRESLGMALNSHAERVCPDGGLSPCGGRFSLSTRESLGMALNASTRESLGMALNSHAERVCPDGGLSPCGGRFFPVHQREPRDGIKLVHQRKPRDGFKLARREGLPRWRTITVRRAVIPCPSERASGWH
jgi:hypothetical protein